jgi:hypothetical protein
MKPRIFNFAPPLSEKLLKENNFFELYPLDGGGYFIMKEILQTLDDAEIAEKILRFDALKDFGDIPDIYFKKFEKWRSVEKSCWINRFYFIVPLAKMHWLSGDEKIASSLKKIIMHFWEQCPPPATEKEIGEFIERVYFIRDNNYNKKSYEEYKKDETDISYVWFDFQPAARLIHLLISMYFLKGSSSFSEQDWKIMEEIIKAHADIIEISERKFLKPKISDNHQSIRGLALLYAAAFFRDSPETAKKYLEQGLKICGFHISNDFFEDGILKEMSPSYHMFESWHIRDAFLISQKYGFDLEEKSKAVLSKAFNFIEAVKQPNGSSVPLNDGYSVRLDNYIKSFPDCLKSKKKEIVSFNNSGLAIYKSKDDFLLLDASPYPGDFSHYHGGKCAIVYWKDGIPFFVDSGTCSYDDVKFRDYKQAASHSSLLVKNEGDSVLSGTYNWNRSAEPELLLAEMKADSINMRAAQKSNSEAWNGVKWERNINISPQKTLTITDFVSSTEIKTFSFIFNLHPDVIVKEKASGEFILINGKVSLKFRFQSKTPLHPSIETGIYFSEKHIANHKILISFKAQKEKVFFEISSLK